MFKNGKPDDNPNKPNAYDNSDDFDYCYEFDKFDISNTCSATECTGLIQTPPMSEEELESYKEIYGFEPPNPKFCTRKENVCPKKNTKSK